MKDLGMWCVVLGILVVGFLFWVSRKLGVDFNVAAQVVGGAVLVLGGAAGLAWQGSNDRSYSWVPWQFFLPVLWAVSAWPLLRAKGAKKLPEFMFDRGFEPEYEWFAQGWFLWGGLIVLVALAAWWWWSDQDM